MRYLKSKYREHSRRGMMWDGAHHGGEWGGEGGESQSESDGMGERERGSEGGREEARGESERREAAVPPITYTTPLHVPHDPLLWVCRPPTKPADENDMVSQPAGTPDGNGMVRCTQLVKHP